MKNYVFIIKIIILIFVVYNSVSFVSLSNSSDNMVFMDSNLTVIEKNMFSKNLISYLYINKDNNYVGKVYNTNTNEEINYNELFNMDKYNDYKNKILELLYKKYPKFVVDVLNDENVTYEYVFRNSELVIYFYNYNLDHELNELIYLTINYNEIKEYLSFPFILTNNYENESGYNYNDSKPSVAITFDDSPSGNNTTRILSALKDNYMHATFFVIGEKMEGSEDILLSIKQNGNEVGTHTYSHQNLYKLSDEEIIEDYNRVNDIYKNLFVSNIKMFRPPYGNIKETQKNLLPVSYILWSLDTNDWRYRNKDYLVNYVLDNIKDGDIILFHDCYESTVDAIEELLPILYIKGYQVMSVSELFKLKEIPINENEVYYSARIRQ